MQQFERHSKVDIGVVFDAISKFVATHEIDLNQPSKIHGGTTAKNRNRVEVNGVPVRVASLRLLTFFKTGIKCHCCGVSATHFAIERNPQPGINNSPFHLNLWGTVEDGEILFTHDHIVAKANGGGDNLSNTQTMCLNCNMEKGSS